MTDRRSPAAVRPFVVAPDASRYYPAAVAEEARQRISRAISRGEGPALLIGATGAGKSLLLEVLAEQFREARDVVPLAAGQICTRRALWQTILFQLDLPYRGMDEGELRLSLLEYLRPTGKPARRLLVLVDEADSLPIRLLDELRGLANESHRGEMLVSMVLAGGPSLEERFADPQLSAFSQRISTRCYLSPLGREETFQYIRAQVAAAGIGPESLFTLDALEAIFAATDGVPRLVNQLGDQLTWSRKQTSQTPLNAVQVQQAWSELQQLPAPWNTPAVAPTAAESIVEFGELESAEALEDDDMPASIPISGTRQDAQFIETFDATESLFEQIENLHSFAGEVQVEKLATIPPAYDPFAEAFGSEEVVFDQYTAFESALLETAPRVINRLDTAFAAQLRELALPVASSSSSPIPVVDYGALDEIDTELDPIDLAEVRLAEESRAQRDPGELLVVEDHRRAHVALVPGKKFRQLFSSLEKGQPQSLLG